MIKYIFNKILLEKKDTISSIMSVACFMSVIIVCFQVVDRLLQMLKDDWYKESLEILSQGDPMIREKLGIIIGFVIVLISIIIIFCIVVYVLKLKLDIARERQRISVFLVLGYTKIRVVMCFFISKVIELLLSSVFGGVIGYVIWKILCVQEVFKDFLSLIDKKLIFKVEHIFSNLCMYMMFTLVFVYIIISKNVHLTDMKGED